MRTFVILTVGMVVLAGAATAAYRPAIEYWALRNKPVWRTAEVEQGSLVAVVNSTGTVKPKLQVIIGSFVSGPILELYCEFNQEVKKGDLLARIDPRIYESNVARDRAALANREADVARMQTLVQQAVTDEQRTISLRKKDSSFITQAEVDNAHFNRLTQEAQLKVSETAVDQARAILENSLANLAYTEIRAPVDGMIIDRKIDPGQTLAAQFQTPELFVMAPDMREEIHIHASVDEADIGLIQEAQRRKYPVSFTVDAHPDQLFEGVINEIRLSSATTQNVVTYPVIVSAPNPDLKLLPGMTASLSFQVDHRADVVKIPNAALRFYPAPKHVRPADLPVLEGNLQAKGGDAEGVTTAESSLSALDRTQRRMQRHRRHVWVAEGNLLRAVEVTTGLSDSSLTEMVEGPLKKGDLLVTGIRPAAFAAAR